MTLDAVLILLKEREGLRIGRREVRDIWMSAEIPPLLRERERKLRKP